MLADPVPESPVAQRPAEDSTTAADELGGNKRLASTADGLATVPRATAEAARSSGADAGVADAAPEARAKKPIVLEEQTMFPEASTGVVGHAVWPQSPPVVPPATVEEDEVEEIECEESRP